MDQWSSEMIKVTIVFTVLAIVCAGLLYFAVRSWRTHKQEKQRATAMQTWPVTTGSAKKWKVVYSTGFRGRYKHYETKITYEYYVDAKDYLIDVFDKEFPLRDDAEKAKKEAEAWAQSIVEQAKQIDIYYNPKDPSDSGAEIKDIGAISFTGLAIVIAVLSLFLLVFISFPLIALGIVGYSLFLHFTGR